MHSQSVLSLRAMAAGIGALALATLSSPASAAGYNFTSFDGPGNNGGGTTANGINSVGDVVGFSTDAASTLFTNFIRNPNGSFDILSTEGDPLAMANGINDARTVVGGLSSGVAFALSGGGLTILPAAAPGTTASQRRSASTTQGRSSASLRITPPMPRRVICTVPGSIRS